MRRADPDVVVAGSGAAGLVTALVCSHHGLAVTVCESAELFGGTTALSGGRVWIPGHPWGAGPALDRLQAREYLLAVYGTAHPEMIDAFLESGPQMARFVERSSGHRFVVCPSYPDYHPGLAGASTGGRSLDAAPYQAARGGVGARVRRPPGYVPITHAEWERWRLPSRYDRRLIENRLTGGVVTGGVALCSALVDALVAQGATMRSGSPVSGIEPDGVGYAVTLAGGETLHGRCVVLATGGFDRAGDLVSEHLPAPVAASGSPPSNVGDGMRLAAALGARIDLLGQGWWMPMIAVPGETIDGAPAYRSLVRERAFPRHILVDRHARRFADEAAPYHQVGIQMISTGAGGEPVHDPVHMIFDRGYLERYGFPGADPATHAPGWMNEAPTIEALAAGIGLNPSALAREVERWNRDCALGVDRAFGRGSNLFDRYGGDPETAAPNLGPIEQPPFYAVRVLAGTIGTKGGPITDPDARVLDHAGRPIDGLFAVGNTSAFWTGAGYPGPGATLGAGMTFAYRAGRAISGRLSTPSAN